MRNTRFLVLAIVLAAGVALAEDTLPSGWESTDIGSPGQAGSAAYDPQTSVFTVQGGGVDVWDQADHCQLLYQERSSSLDIRARVSSVQNTNAWAKAGVEIRATTDAGSIHAMLVATPGNGVAFQFRSNTNDYMTHSGAGAASFPNAWVRLIRNGNTITAYKGTDAEGTNWEQVGSVTLELPDSVLVGLLVTAHDDAQLCAATFDGVQVYDVPQGSGDGLKGYYYADQDLSRTPALARVDPTVNFDWGQNAPDASLPADHFSVRWLGQVEPQFSETYTFYARADDGVRLWVNGQLLVDQWHDQGATEYSGQIALQAGQKCDVRMEYYENGGDASAQLRWSSASTPKQIIPQTQLYSTGNAMVIGNGTGLNGYYYSDQNLARGPALTRVDPTVNFDWGQGEADPSLPADHFSTRWLGQVEPQFSETYTFYARADDGVRLWVNGQLLVDEWIIEGATEYSGSIALQVGQKYDVRMEYCENGGDAVAQLRWSSPSTPKQIVPQTQLYPTGGGMGIGTGTGLAGEYSNDTTFTDPVLARVDPVVDFDWGGGSPDPVVNSDNFTVRWQGQVQAQFSETYTFTTRTDDGVRLWVNGELLVDK